MNLRRIRFSLRSLLLSIAVTSTVAAAVGWRAAQVRIERSIAAEITRLGGYVRFEEQTPRPDWLAYLLSEDWFAQLYLIECDSPLLARRLVERNRLVDLSREAAFAAHKLKQDAEDGWKRLRKWFKANGVA